MTDAAEELDPRRFQRIHGDCHRGNVLQTDEPGQPKEFFLIDFDDFGMGPVAQDFWMLFRRDDEDFADDIATYFLKPADLKAKSPKIFGWMEKHLAPTLKRRIQK